MGFPDGTPANVGDIIDRGMIPGLEGPLKKGMATHSIILAWRIPMVRGAWWATVYGSPIPSELDHSDLPYGWRASF